MTHSHHNKLLHLVPTITKYNTTSGINVGITWNGCKNSHIKLHKFTNGDWFSYHSQLVTTTQTYNMASTNTLNIRVTTHYATIIYINWDLPHL